MNCETYRMLLMDDVKEAEDALAHSASCAACAEAARERQHLLSVLRRVREEDARNYPSWSGAAGEESIRVEKHLLAAFRDLRAARQPVVLPEASWNGSVSPPGERSSEGDALPMLTGIPQEPSETRLPKWGALAAAAALSFGVLLWISQTPRVPSLPSPPRLSRVTQLPREWRVSSARAREEDERPAPARERKSATEGTARTAKTLSVDEMAAAANSEAPEARSMPLISPAAGQNSSTASTRVAASPTTGGDQFLPLVPGTAGFLDDGPVVMRVRMPYAAAEYLGAAAGVASHGQPPRGGFVQADLLVGSDGTTRAIRFVQ